MSIIENIPFIGEDTRSRKYLLPVSIAETKGNVIRAESLLKQKPLQIGISETDYASLQNGEDGENASVVLDFGQEMQGGIRLMVYHTSGDLYPEVRITFGESLTEAMSSVGEKGATNDHAVRDFKVPMPMFSDQEWGQTGFRYVKLELLNRNSRVDLKSALAVFVYREYPYIGHFECSDPLVNQIFDTAAYTCHLNLQHMVWDGIKRDRLVWIGDMHPEMLTIRSVFGALPIVEESLVFVRDQTPLPGWMNGIPTYSMWWLLIVWDWYRYTQNDVFMQAQKEYIEELLQLLCSIVSDTGEDTLSDYFFDWPTREQPSAKSGVRCVLKMALEAGESLAHYYGNHALEALCLEKKVCLAQGEEQHFDAKQVAAFMALSGAMDTDAAASVITQNGIKGLSTFLLYYMLRVVAQSGQDETAMELLKEYSCAMLDKGATTFWEDFHEEWIQGSGVITSVPENSAKDIHGDYGAYCYEGFRHSLCHGWASGAVPFLMEQVLGVQIAETGCRKLEITPHLGKLQYARGSYPTPFGTVKIEHTRDAQHRVVTKVEAPAEVEVVVQQEVS